MIHKLASYFNLTEGWDTRHAETPSAKAVAGAIVVLTYLEVDHPGRLYVDQVSPSIDGGIELECEHNGQFVNVTVTNQGLLKLERSDGEFTEYPWDGSQSGFDRAAFVDVKKAFRWLFLG